MKKATVTISFITVILLFINAGIFLYRNHGFEYKDYFPASAATAVDCDESCIRKWTKHNSKFLPAELDEAYKLLQQNINIDSIQPAENKLIVIGAWLRKGLSDQKGIMSDSLKALSPLKQYYCFKEKNQFNFDCGNFQAIYSLFCTSVKLPCRNFQNIQLNADSLEADSHVANEVYLKEYKKWVLTDAYQNHLLIKKRNTPLSAAEYLDYNIAGGKDTLCIIKQSGGKIFIDTVTPKRFKEDFYFNKNYILYFYKQTDTKEIYSQRNRVKRYFLADSWYKIYAPQQKSTILLFRIKQVFFLLLAAWLIFVSVRYFRNYRK
jgi:hypothetical protein